MEIIILLILGVIGVFVALVSLKSRNAASERLPPERFAELSASLIHPDELERLLRTQNKIAAIKLFRQETGTSLREAKYAVDQIQAEMLSVPSVGLDDTTDAILQQIAAGNKIKAIKLYRQKTRAGLKAAKEAVESLAVGGAQSQQERHYVDSDELQNLLRANRKIEAIKLHRLHTGSTLKEAKEAIERLQTQMASE